MIELKDRIPTLYNRRKIIDENTGTETFAVIERADEPLPGNEGTQINAQFFKDLILAIYPVGSVYMSVKGDDPSTLFGGTWEAWGKGRVPVSVNTGGSGVLSQPEAIGGHASMQMHRHEITDHRHNATVHGGGSVVLPPNRFGAGTGGGSTQSAEIFTGYIYGGSLPRTGYEGDGNAGNWPPYITCYMWKRTA